MRNHNWTKYVTAIAHFRVSVEVSLRGIGVLKWRFIGVLRIEHPHSGLFDRYFMRCKKLNVREAWVTDRPPVRLLLHWTRRSRFAQGSIMCHLSERVP